MLKLYCSLCIEYIPDIFVWGLPVCPTYEIIRYIKYNNLHSAHPLNIIQNVHE